MPAHMTVRAPRQCRATPKPAKGTAAKARTARRNEKARNWRAVCKAVDERDGRLCVVCCSGYHIEHHHIKKRSQGGPDAPENVVTLCGWCHMAVHTARLDIYRNSSGDLVIVRFERRERGAA